jgi:hypothetical protein
MIESGFSFKGRMLSSFRDVLELGDQDNFRIVVVIESGTRVTLMNCVENVRKFNESGESYHITLEVRSKCD